MQLLFGIVLMVVVGVVGLLLNGGKDPGENPYGDIGSV